MEQPTLLDTMSQLAQQQCDELLAEARRQAESIRAAAEREREKRREAALDEARETAARHARLCRDRAAAEAEKQALVMREVVVDELLERIEERLAQLAAGEQFAPILKALLREALGDAQSERAGAGSDELIVQVPSAYKTQCEEWLVNLGIANAEVRPSESLRDGTIVENREHGFRIVNTLSTRFAKMREEARSLCQKRLFGERATHGA